MRQPLLVLGEAADYGMRRGFEEYHKSLKSGFCYAEEARKYLKHPKADPFEISEAQTRSQTNPNASLNHNLMTQHPKSLKILIWDAIVPLKTSQIFKNPNLGCNCSLKIIPNL